MSIEDLEAKIEKTERALDAHDISPGVKAHTKIRSKILQGIVATKKTVAQNEVAHNASLQDAMRQIEVLNEAIEVMKQEHREQQMDSYRSEEQLLSRLRDLHAENQELTRALAAGREGAAAH